MKRISNLQIAHVIALTIATYIAMGIICATYAAGPTEHTKQQITNYLKSNNVSVSDQVNYTTTPVKNTERGDISTASKNSAVKMLNNMRYIAGLNPVQLDNTYGIKAQAATFVMMSTGKYSHYLDEDTSKPAEMSTTNWNYGVEGAKSSNIGSGYSTLNQAIVYGWMSDSGSSNVSRVGHRRWCLNPAMGKTGFGMSDRYVAMWSFDTSGTGTQTNVAWPARYMPVEYFSVNDPWTLSTGLNLTSSSGISVTLKRLAGSPSGAKTWTFSGNYTPSSSGKYFNVENSGYGQKGCIIFRPDGINEYKSGDIFEVVIIGAGASTIKYQVEFFNGYPIETVKFENSTYYFTQNSSRMITPRTTPSDAEGYEMTWKSSNPSVASVDSKGVVTGQREGESTTITVTIPGEYTSSGTDKTASYTAYVSKNIRTGEGMSVQISNPRYTGSEIKPSVVVKDGSKILTEDVDYTLRYPSGLIEPSESYEICWIYGKNKYCDNVGKFFTVNKQLISNCELDVSPEEIEYSGSMQKPKITLKNGNKTLVEGTDYTLSIQAGRNVGTYEISITAANGSKYYTGSTTSSYKIKPKDINNCKKSINTSSITYNGSIRKPSVTIENSSTTLVEGTDYVLETGNSINRGTHNYTITGKGNYTGQIKGTFRIYPGLITDKNTALVKESYEYTGSVIIPNFIYNDSTKLIEGKDYDIEIVNGPAIDCGNYTARITGRSDVDESCNYSGTITKTFVITPCTLKRGMIAAIGNVKYDGKWHTPNITVKQSPNSSRKLARNIDYIITNDGKGKNAGTYTVTIKGTGNYMGDTSSYYIIVPKSLNDSDVAIQGGLKTYTGKVVNPTVSASFIIDGLKTTINSSDLTVSYANQYSGIDAGGYKVKISGKNNFKDERTATFTIGRKDINDSDITVNSIPDQVFTGNKIQPTITIKHGNKHLTGKDYHLEFENNIKEGVATVKIFGDGNYSGSRKKQFSIKEQKKTVVPEKNNTNRNAETIPTKTTKTTKLKNVWASKHEVGKVTFKWTKKDKVKVSGWNVKYRTRKIGGNNYWSGWTTKSYGPNTMQAIINIPRNYAIELHAQAKGDNIWSNGIITTPAGGKYQAMKYAHVKNLRTNKKITKEGKVVSLNLKVGQSLRLMPDHEYPVRDYVKRPRLYPTHMLYDVADRSIIGITKPNGSKYTGGIIDGIATVKALKAGSTTLVCRAPNGRTNTIKISVKK